MLVNNLLLLLQPVPIALPENNLMLNLKPVPIALLVKNRTTVPPLVPIALRVKLLRMEELHASIVRSEKRVPLELTVLRRVLRVKLRSTVLPHVPLVLPVKFLKKVLPVPIVLRVKLLPLHSRHVSTVLSEKRVPLELTVLRRVLLGKLHPMVPPFVPFVLLVKRRLQRQQMVVPIALRVKLRMVLAVLVPIAKLGQFLLVVRLVTIAVQVKLLPHHSKTVSIVLSEKRV